MELWALVLAGGKGSRLLQAADGVAKQFLTYNGDPLYWASIMQFIRCTKISGIVAVFPQGVKASEEKVFISLVQKHNLSLPYIVTNGGVLRQNSVNNGLSQLPEKCTHVLIHDAARPFVSLTTINRVIDKLESGAEGVIPGVPVTDTIKYINDGKVEYTPDREHLLSVQTPQGFQKSLLIESHIKAEEENWVVTDDASLFERCGHDVHVVEGELGNIKITYVEDLKMLKQKECSTPIVGYGYDVHKYAVGEKSEKQQPRAMKLGGLLISAAPEVLAHSDGDVVLHALMDALLGCIGEGDIGQHFPDTDKNYDGICSSVLLGIVLDKVCKANIQIVHVDITIVAQIPKISPQRLAIKENIVKLLGIDSQHVSIKATTEEGLGFTGEGKGIKAITVVTAIRLNV